MKPVLNVSVENEIRRRIERDLDGVQNLYTDRMFERIRNWDYYKGDQWTPDEIAMHHSQKRHPYVFNEVEAKVNHWIGTQTQTRMESRIIGREKGDAAAAELLNHLIKWAEQANSMEIVETDVFKENIIGGAGAAVVRWEHEDLGYGYPKVEAVPINQMRWDPIAKKKDLEDARWIARVVHMSRQSAKEMFPQHAEVIDRTAVIAGGRGIDGGIYDNIENDYEQDAEAAVNWGLSGGTHQRELIEVVEYYEKVKVHKYVVANSIEGNTKSFDSQKEADAFYEGLVDGYLKSNTSLSNGDGTQRIVQLVTTANCVYQSIMIGLKVIEHNKLAMPDFPYVMMFAQFQDGEYWSPIRSLIDPQMFLNRSLSTLDNVIGSSTKNMLTVQKELLGTGFGLEDLRREISKVAPIIKVKDHRAIQAHSPSPVNPALFDTMSFAISRMNDYSGGKNLLGLQENAAESGRAVMARAEAGGTGKLPMFDNMRIWRKSITERVIWWTKNYMSDAQIFRVIGAHDDVPFVQLDDGVLNTFREIKLDIIIDEAVKSDTVKERELMQFKELAQVVPIPPPVLTKIMTELSTLPESTKREIMEAYETYNQFEQQQQAQQEEAKMTKEVQDSFKRKKMKETLELTEDLQQVEQDLATKEKAVKKQLDDIEKAEMQMREGATSPMERGRQQESLNTSEEIRKAQGAQTRALLQQ